MAIVASSPYASSSRSGFCLAVKTISQKFNSDHVVPFHPSLAPYYYRKKNFFHIRSPLLCSLFKTFALGKFIIALSHSPFFCFSGCSFCLECSNKQTIFLRHKSRVASIMPLLKLDWTIPLYSVGAHLCTLRIWTLSSTYFSTHTPLEHEVQ